MPIPTYNLDSKPSLAFPDKVSEQRQADYEKYDKLQCGDHFEAFNIASEGKLKDQYGKLRYIVANFPGLISKVVADMLFSDPIKFNLQNDDSQAFIDALTFNNKLHIQNYESAVSNSARGDALYKLRIGKRYETDEKSSIIIENINPYIYYPTLDQMNMQNSPKEEVLAWFVNIGGKMYVQKEIHTSGLITNQIWSYDKDSKQLINQLIWRNFFPDQPEIVETRVKRNLIVHVPNWRVGTEYFGISDYEDLLTLFLSLNNRITKIDNILDKHSNPILAVPDGFLNEDGEVNQQFLDVIEVPADGSGQKPEYIVWNANLESAFKQIDHLIDSLFMYSEISPAAVGMDKNTRNESGIALKLKLIRTIAKKKRKERYYDQGLKEVMTLAQELAQVWPEVETVMDGVVVPAPKQIETPDISFGDGIVRDTLQAAQEEQIRISSGTTSQTDAIQRLDGVDEDVAEETVKEIQDEQGLNLPLTQPQQQTNVPPASQSMQPGSAMGKTADENMPMNNGR